MVTQTDDRQERKTGNKFTARFQIRIRLLTQELL